MGHSHDHHDDASHAGLVRTEQVRYHHFITLALWLAVITAVEVVLIMLPMTPDAVSSILIGLSVFKFFAVIAWFMHIIYDKRILFYLFAAGLAIAFATVVALVFLFEPEQIDTTWFGR